MPLILRSNIYTESKQRYFGLLVALQLGQKAKEKEERRGTTVSFLLPPNQTPPFLRLHRFRPEPVVAHGHAMSGRGASTLQKRVG